MSTEAWLAAGFGGVFVALLFGTALYLLARPDRPIPGEAMWILRVILALAGAGLGTVMSGMLKVDLNIPHVVVQATCGFALFVLIYLVNPPGRFARAQRSGRDQDGDMNQTVGPGGKAAQARGDGNRINIS